MHTEGENKRGNTDKNKNRPQTPIFSISVRESCKMLIYAGAFIERIICGRSQFKVTGTRVTITYSVRLAMWILNLIPGTPQKNTTAIAAAKEKHIREWK